MITHCTVPYDTCLFALADVRSRVEDNESAVGALSTARANAQAKGNMLTGRACGWKLFCLEQQSHLCHLEYGKTICVNRCYGSHVTERLDLAYVCWFLVCIVLSSMLSLSHSNLADHKQKKIEQKERYDEPSGIGRLCSDLRGQPNLVTSTKPERMSCDLHLSGRIWQTRTYVRTYVDAHNFVTKAQSRRNRESRRGDHKHENRITATAKAAAAIGVLSIFACV